MKTMKTIQNPLRQVLNLSVSALYEAYSGKMMVAVMAVLGTGFTLALFLGEVAITETAQMQQALLAGFLRIGLVFVLAVFVVNGCVRDIQDRSMLLVLSLPVSRSTVFFGRFCAYILVALMIVIAACALLAVFAPLAHILPWGLTLWLESVLVIAFGLVCAFSFTQVPLAITAVAGFYLLSRSMSAILLIAHHPIVYSNSLGQTVLVHLADGLALLLPSLDQFARAELIVQGAGPDFQLPSLLFQGLVYCTLLISIALFDLYRKNF